MRIGVDVGGTNTDAVLLEDDRVLAKVKTATTADVTSGIQASLSALTRDAQVDPTAVGAVMIGTTHFTNAFVEGRDLCPVAVVRLCLPSTQAVPPLLDWPDEALAKVTATSFLCHGGHEFDGRRISEVVTAELEQVAKAVRRSGLESIALSAVHSPVNPEDEVRAAAILGELLPGVPISLSHEIGRIGLLERENATIVNACLRPLATRTVAAFRDAVTALGIEAPVYVSQNDGTLASMEVTEKYPVTTFTSGPTNSMRGAAFLSGVADAAVVDIGGTTADIGIIQSGFPRETTTDAQIGGVRTNFRLPDVVSLGIGGGSRVVLEPELAVGPASVGHAIRSEGLVFGGATLTATDLAVADGRAEVGDASLVRHLRGDLVRRALDHVEEEIADAVDLMRTSPEPLPVVLVGGGSILLRDRLPGASEVLRPPHYEVANAVGAAIAQVGGVCEQIHSLAVGTRDEAVAQVRAGAEAAAVAAGADPATVHVVDVEEVAMAYLPGAQTRIKVRAVGDLRMEREHALHR